MEKKYLVCHLNHEDMTMSNNTLVSGLQPAVDLAVKQIGQLTSTSKIRARQAVEDHYGQNIFTVGISLYGDEQDGAKASTIYEITKGL